MAQRLTTCFIFGLLALAYAGIGWAGSYSNIAGNLVVNPITSNNASGSNVPTTGTILISSNQLTVANATGWSVGMGIAVANAGTGGNTELITTVTAISGTTFTLAATAIAGATTQAVNHDDTVALSGSMTTAMLSGAPLHLPVGNYNVTSGLIAVTAPITMYGDGEHASIIFNRSKTANVLTISYPSAIPSNIEPWSALFEDFQIEQAGNVTPTAGFAILVSSLSVPNYVTNLHVNRVTIQNTWAGISVGAAFYKSWMTNININYLVNGPGISYSTAVPAGDVAWDNVMMLGLNTGLTITQSDTQIFTGLKINGGQILFNGAATANINRVRFVSPSIEGLTGSPTCAVDFGANGATQISIEGGEVGGFTTPFCNMANVVNGLSIVGVLEANTAFAALNTYTYLPAIIGNGAVPAGSGSCPINTQAGGNTVGKFSANGLCTAGTVILTFATTATNGWVCDAHDQTTPADIMNQTASSPTTVTLTGTMASADVVAFKCMAY